MNIKKKKHKLGRSSWLDAMASFTELGYLRHSMRILIFFKKQNKTGLITDCIKYNSNIVSLFILQILQLGGGQQGMKYLLESERSLGI